MAEKTAAKKETLKGQANKEEATTAKAEVKTEAKKETAPETKTETHTGQAKVAKKFIQYTKKENKKKSKEAVALQKSVLNKKHTPVFRGRFGKKNIRRKSIAKWDKWRKPHGIDLDKGLQHGFRPKIGYRRHVEFRFIHPSGYKEVLVCNMNDLAKIDPKVEAIRISATMGKRKRNILVAKANEKGVWILN